MRLPTHTMRPVTLFWCAAYVLVLFSIYTCVASALARSGKATRVVNSAFYATYAPASWGAAGKQSGPPQKQSEAAVSLKPDAKAGVVN